MKLILVRHGETEVNRAGLTLSRSDVPLNEKGRLQVQRLAASFAGQQVASIYSSPLQRARSTAQAIADALGLAVQVEDDLIELDTGETEGFNAEQLWERFPDFMAGWTGTEAPTVLFPGGSETLSEAQERAWGVVERLRQQHDSQTVVIVSHAFVILVILCRALGMSLSNFRNLRTSLAAKSVLETRPDRVILVSYNDTCHLGELQTAPLWEGRRLRRAEGEQEGRRPGRVGHPGA